MNIEFSLNRKELLSIFLLGVRSRPAVFWIGIVFFIILPLVAALAFTILKLHGANVPWVSVWILLACPPLTVIGFALIPILLYGKSPMLRGIQRYGFSSEGIHVETDSVDSRLKWSGFTGFSLSNAGLLLFSGKAALLCIPGKAISSSMASELRNLLNSKGLKDVSNRNV